MDQIGQLVGQVLGSGAGNQILGQLFSGIQGGDVGSILSSIGGGADVNAKHEENGMTPLQMAIMAGLTEIVKLLLSKGADVNVPNEEGKNAVDMAQQAADEAPDEETKSKYEEMVQMLQQHQ